MDPHNLMKYQGGMHLFCFASWFGCSMWVSFIAGLVMFHNLPRHVFGRLQAKLFPRYFQWSFGFVAMTLFLNAVGPLSAMLNISPDAAKSTSASSSTLDLPTSQIVNLLLILAVILTNMLYFEPVTTAVMFE